MNGRYNAYAIFARDNQIGRARYIFSCGVDVPETLLPRCFRLP